MLPGALVLWFVLHPDHLGIRVLLQDCTQLFRGIRVELFEPHDSRGKIATLFPFVNEIVVEAPGAQQHAGDFADPVVYLIDNGAELARGEVLERGYRRLAAQ